MKFDNVIIPTELLQNEDLSLSESVILSVIRQYSFTGKSSVKVKNLAKYCNFTEKKILEIGKKLAEKKLITIENVAENMDCWRMSAVISDQDTSLKEVDLITNVSTKLKETKNHFKNADMIFEALIQKVQRARIENFILHKSSNELLFHIKFLKESKRKATNEGADAPSKASADAAAFLRNNKNLCSKVYDSCELRKEVKWMIDFWNKKSSSHGNLPKKLNKSHGGMQTKVYAETVEACKQFLSGRLYTTKGIGLVPKKLHHIRPEIERKYTYTEFEMFVNRFMKVLLDREIKPVNKKFVQENCTLRNFLAGNLFGQVSSLLLDFCYTEPETVYELVNPEYLSCIEKSWSQINRNYESSGLNKEILDKSLTLIFKIYKRNKIKPEKYKITITETLPVFFKKHWKSSPPRVTYLISEAFVENYKSFISDKFMT